MVCKLVRDSGFFFLGPRVTVNKHCDWLCSGTRTFFLRTNPYLSELPDDTRWFDLPIARAVPHPDEGLPLGYLSTQLRHRVEADLLLRRVFKVLQQKGRHGYLLCIYSINMWLVAMKLLWKENWKKVAVTEIKTLLCLLSNCFGTSLFLP